MTDITTRTSKSQLKKNPKLRGKDLETTRKACEKFKEMPVSVVNFVEGTRFTVQKHARQNSPFPYLLKPKAGGVAFVMQAMGEQISKVVNVTIHYPEGIPTFMDFAWFTWSTSSSLPITQSALFTSLTLSLEKSSKNGTD